MDAVSGALYILLYMEDILIFCFNTDVTEANPDKIQCELSNVDTGERNELSAGSKRKSSKGNRKKPRENDEREPKLKKKKAKVNI